MRRTSVLVALSAMAAAVAGPALLQSGAAATLAADGDCAAPTEQLQFEMAYVDESRAGGEPIITRHPDGQLLWGSHAGTTHFYSPESPSPATAPFVENYEGQTYYYVTEDNQSWDFVPRTPVQAAAPVLGIPATGFSDPEFAIDQAGNVWVSEINLANVAISKSTDGGRSYELVNVFAFTSSDRQWMAADREDEVYMTANGFGGGSFPASPIGNLGHFMAKSTDGGLTWGAASTTNPNGVGDIQIDHDRGILYEMSVTADSISIARFANIRDEETDFTVEILPIAEDVSLSGVQQLIDPTFDLDEDGNLYATWSDNPDGDGANQGIFFAYSTDQGDTWSEPQRVDLGTEDDVWPWITVGAPGEVAVTWLQSSESTDAQLGGEAGGDAAEWHVMVAHTDTGLGCADGELPGFSVVQASSEPIHTGTICQHGTTCQTDLTDRRLGDYFSIETDDAGLLHIAVSDTRQGGAVALPLHIRQVEPATTGGGGTDTTDDDTTTAATDDPATDDVLANTGGGAALLSLALLGAAAVSRRRERS